jgi:hypothetical protein
MIKAHGGFYLPGGDMADRFGNNFIIGAAFSYKSSKNWVFNFDAGFITGNNIREQNILQNLVNGQGQVVGIDGSYATIVLSERGFNFNFGLGKVFPIIGPNPNSGLLISSGLGLIQHKIRIFDETGTVSALKGNYKKGYDRLTNGLCINPFIGYVNFSNNRLLNFSFGLDCLLGFTQSRRSFNYDLRMVDQKNRQDVLIGLKTSWIIPLYKKTPLKYYFR